MAVFLIHSFCVFFMTGVIWFAQVIQYPLMKRVDKKSFHDYHEIHVRRITWMVGPVMILQLGSAAYLFFDAYFPILMTVAILALSIAVFVSTTMISVPAHNKLALEFSDELVDHLTTTNWIRTALWTIHSLLLFSFVIFSSHN